jgi:hypothetical protein
MRRQAKMAKQNAMYDALAMQRKICQISKKPFDEQRTYLPSWET